MVLIPLMWRVKKFKNLVDNDWNVENDKKIIREFGFSDYQTGINFTNKVAELAEDEGHHPHIHINFKKMSYIFIPNSKICIRIRIVIIRIYIIS